MRRIGFGMASAIHAAALLSLSIPAHDIERSDVPASPKPRIRKKKMMKRKKHWWKDGKPNSGRDSKKHFLKGLR